MKTYLSLLALVPAVLAGPHINRRQTANTIPGRWIAILNDDHDPFDVVTHVQSLAVADSAHASDLSGFDSIHQYSLDGFKGFAFDGGDDLLDLLSGVDSIASIHPDGISYTAGRSEQVNCKNGVCTTVRCDNGICTTIGGGNAPTPAPEPPSSSSPADPTTLSTKTTKATGTTPAKTSTAPGESPTSGNLINQSNAPWGLGRISHREAGSTTYSYDSSAGSGATVYVIDSGINTAHSDFEGRASLGPSFVSGVKNVDGLGHGTHCAGTIGSKTYGVAKKANIIGVKVLNDQGSGQNSDIIAGIQWAVKDAQDNNRVSTSVISMSIGGDFSTASNSAVAAAIKAGVFVTVAAGNSNANSANYSPASESTVCTIGATDDDDAKASFSNYGSVVDVFGPGVNILSTWIGSNSATKLESGTSMATPHIAGLAAYLLALEGPRAPQDLCARIASIGTKNKITGLPSGTVNSIAYNNNGL